MSCGSGSVDVTNSTPTVRTGFLRRYKKGCFSKGWKTEYVVLHKDSMLVWYKERGDAKARGRVILQNVCNFIAAGPYTRNIPARPALPKGCTERHVLAIPALATKQSEIYWFLFDNDAELNQWMTSVCQTLPPPPQPSVPASAPPQGAGQGTYPPPGGTAYPPPGGTAYPPPGGQHAYGGVPQGGGGYPQQQHGNRAGAPHTTVVVQGQQGGRSGFTEGMMLGGMMGMGYWGWGYGGGWGYPGWGYYGGYGMHHHDHTEINNTNVENNYYDVDNTQNNDVTNTENNDYGDATGGDVNYADQGFQGGAYEDPKYDDGGYEQGGHEQGGYEQGGFDQGGYEQGGYDGGYDQGGYDGGYDQGGFDGGYDDGGGFDGGGFDDGGDFGGDF